MRRQFLTTFLWFWLTLLAVSVLFLLLFTPSGFRWRLLHMPLHNLVVLLAAGGIFCFLISSYITRPLHRLGEAAANIADGRLETRVDSSLRNRRDEIATLAGNFDLMAERIEALVNGQRRLLGDVSHELRSPLARLVVALGLAKQGPPEEAAENLERIGVEVRRLDTLLGQLLTLTRIDSGADQRSLARIDLTNLVQEIASDADFEARAQKRRVIVKRSDACTVQGFEELLRSAMENVVRNAVRYTAEATAVEISVHNEHTRAVLTVRDYGPGVPEDMLEEMFLPFRRVTVENHDGAGLGLAIAQRAVRAHRGTIRAANVSPGGGLIVELVLDRSWYRVAGASPPIHA